MILIRPLLSCLQEPSESSHWRWRSPAPCLHSSRRCWRTLKGWRARGLWVWKEGEEGRVKGETGRRKKQTLVAVIHLHLQSLSRLLPRVLHRAPLPLPLTPPELTAACCLYTTTLWQDVVLQENHRYCRLKLKRQSVWNSLWGVEASAQSCRERNTETMLCDWDQLRRSSKCNKTWSHLIIHFIQPETFGLCSWCGSRWRIFIMNSR